MLKNPNKMRERKKKNSEESVEEFIAKLPIENMFSRRRLVAFILYYTF